MSLLNDIWNNKHLIAEGIKNRVFKKTDIEDVAKHRYDEYCKTCEWNTLNLVGKKYQEAPEEVRQKLDSTWYRLLLAFAGESPRCAYCSCDIDVNTSLKLRCLHCSCPKLKWLNVATQEEAIQIKEIIKIL